MMMINNPEMFHGASGDEKEIIDIPGAELLDNSLGGETEKALEKIEEVVSRAEALAESNPALRERAVTLRDRAVKLGRQIKGAARVLGLSASVALAAATADYELTRYNVIEHADDHGKLIFEHQDQETTQILDYLSGKGELPEADRLALEIQRISKFPDIQKKLSISKKLEAMNEDELSEVWDEIQETLQKQYPEYTYKKRGLRTNEIPGRYEYNEELYRVLWQIEREAGNPKIRFEKSSKKSAFSIALRVNMDRAYYNPATNTIYIFYPAFDDRWAMKELPPVDPVVVDNFVAESSHGRQWQEKPLTHDFRGAKDNISVLISALKNRKTLDGAYEALYKEPGTVEYEAHQQIEPELKKELAHYEATEQEEQEKKSQQRHALEGGWDDGHH